MPIVHHPRHESMSADEHQWQHWGVAKLLSILAIPGWYKNLLSWYNITIDPQLSWEGHAFHKNMGEVVCTQLLDKRGLTLDEADNCHEFAYACIQESNTPQEKDAQLHIHLSSATARATPSPHLNPGVNLYCTGLMKPMQGGANHTATFTGGKQQEYCCYGHLKRYRWIHHTVAG